MVEELKDPPPYYKDLKDPQGQAGRRGPSQNERWGDIYASMPVKKMIALYDYDPHELSPNVDAVRFFIYFKYEISFVNIINTIFNNVIISFR